MPQHPLSIPLLRTVSPLASVSQRIMIADVRGLTDAKNADIYKRF